MILLPGPPQPPLLHPFFLPLQVPAFATCATTLRSQFLEFEAEQGIIMLLITTGNNLVQVGRAKVLLLWRKVGRSDLSEDPMGTCHFALRGTLHALFSIFFHQHPFHLVLGVCGYLRDCHEHLFLTQLQKLAPVDRYKWNLDFAVFCSHRHKNQRTGVSFWSYNPPRQAQLAQITYFDAAQTGCE